MDYALAQKLWLSQILNAGGITFSDPESCPSSPAHFLIYTFFFPFYWDFWVLDVSTILLPSNSFCFVFSAAHVLLFQPSSCDCPPCHLSFHCPCLTRTVSHSWINPFSPLYFHSGLMGNAGEKSHSSASWRPYKHKVPRLSWAFHTVYHFSGVSYPAFSPEQEIIPIEYFRTSSWFSNIFPSTFLSITVETPSFLYGRLFFLLFLCSTFISSTPTPQAWLHGFTPFCPFLSMFKHV